MTPPRTLRALAALTVGEEHTAPRVGSGLVHVLAQHAAQHALHRRRVVVEAAVRSPWLGHPTRRCDARRCNKHRRDAR